MSSKQPVVSVSMVLKRAARAIYENLLMCVAVSAVWGLPIMPGVFQIKMPFAGAYVTFVSLMCIVPAARYTHLAIRCKRTLHAEFWPTLPKAVGQGALLGLMGCIVYTILYSSWWYYRSDPGTLRFILAMVQTYMLAVFSMSLVYVPSVLAITRCRFREAVLTSFRLFFTSTAYSLLLWLQITALAAFLLATTIGFLILFAGIAALIVNVACEELLRDPPDNAPDHGKQGKEPNAVE
ncbi:MAG: hypothetical protein VB144_05525 [Clostridia bacterium]|nr:hypothetical protein [Clostridia bacterium]